jgi:hypothetical protein
MAFPINGVIDDFNRANVGPPPSSNWTLPPGVTTANGPKVSSNACITGAATSQGGVPAFWNPTMFTADCEAYLTYTTQIAGDPVELYLRRDSFSIITFNCYSLQIFGSTTNVIFVNKYVNGSPTNLGGVGTVPSPSIANGDKFGLEVVGNKITAYRKVGAGLWTSLVSYTDSTITEPGYAGFLVSSPGQVIDDFGGGSYPMPSPNWDLFPPIEIT